jgi:hypothetical protein
VETGIQDSVHKQLTAIFMSCLGFITQAADHLVTTEVRPGVKLSYWQMQRPDAVATLLILPGGEGGIGLKNGVPTSDNFLVRTRDSWAAAGFNVALLGKPSDHNDLDSAYRSSAEHVGDLKRIVERLNKDLGKPVWLVGTSRGTISAAAAGIALEPAQIGGIVLTSTVTYGTQFAPVPALAIGNIRAPVLVVHHRYDACRSCDPRDLRPMMDALKGAPVKKLVLVEGGFPSGDACEPRHYHGYNGIEQQVVDAVAEWIRSPKN